MNLFICDTSLQLLTALLICEQQHKQNKNWASYFLILESRNRPLKININAFKKIPYILNARKENIDNISNPNLHNWIKNRKLRETYSIIDSIFYTLKINRQNFENAYIKKELFDILKKIDCVYWHSNNLLVRNLVKKIRSQGGKSIFIDEGLHSYLKINDERKNLIDYRYLLCPKLYSGTDQVVEINKDALSNQFFMETLKEIFSRADSTQLKTNILWIGQDYFRDNKKYHNVAQAHNKVFYDFCIKINPSKFVLREHPAGSLAIRRTATKMGNCLLQRKSAIPFELEIALNHKTPPSQIHTISSTAGLYCLILFPKIFEKTTIHFYIYKFADILGVQIDDIHPGLSKILLTAKSLYPHNIYLVK